MASEVHPDRIKELNDEKPREGGDYVLYWMQSSVRSRFNHALEYAVERANDLEKPLLVVFGLTDDYPDANLRHFTFLLEGLADVQGNLKERDIKMVVRRGSPDEVALDTAKDAALVVTDRGYMRHQKEWRKNVADGAGCEVVQVESDVVVPVETASDKREYAARTIRPKIKKHLGDFLLELAPTKPEKSSMNLSVSGGLDPSNIEGVLSEMKNLDRDVPAVSKLFRGGETEAKRVLDEFLGNRFGTYSENRNQPQTDDVSHMSKYLHYGHISPVEVALAVRESGAKDENVDDYMEELIVRRELPMNFVYYEEDYDKFSSLPDWARKTLDEHADDSREYSYTRDELEEAETHDEYWNAAMREMKYTGYMHNYMRMYWGKKISEWSSSPKYAYETTLYLNNKYFLDGRDPNSYANVLWVFGLHDQAWKERPVLGKTRFMSAGGLERKAKPDKYIEKVDRLVAEVSEED